MHLSIPLFSPMELSGFRARARCGVTHGSLARNVQRLQLLLTFRGGDLDPDAAEGARVAEAIALMELALSPAPDLAALRAKADLFANAATGSKTNLTEMLAASLVADRARLEAALRPKPSQRHEGVLAPMAFPG